MAANIDFYPGMFAAGRLDPGSALLIECMARLPAPKLMLDFACGAGILALAARRCWPDARLHLLDYDALAIMAARENIAGAEYIQGDGLASCRARYDLIVSNPPIHAGAKQDFGVVKELLAAAPRYLTSRGHLVLVTQKTVPIARFAPAATVLAEENGYRVWQI